MVSKAEIRGVLDYLLAHDDDGTFYDAYLCYRIRDMKEEGQISVELAKDACNWIYNKCLPFMYLIQKHRIENGIVNGWSGLRASSPEWAAIRREYLAKWIIELAREDEACERLIEEELGED